MSNNQLNISRDTELFRKKTPPTYMKPFHVRLAEYNAKRELIFNEPSKSVRKKRSADRIRKFWSEINHTRRSLLSSIFDNSNDIRPYANVLIFGRNYVELLDTGAAISCFGSNAAKEIVKSVQDFKRIKSLSGQQMGSHRMFVVI